MRRIDTAALTDVAKILGVAAPSSATQQTLFDDGVLVQNLDVLPGIRRGAGLPQGPLWAFDITQTFGAGPAIDVATINPFDLLEAKFPNLPELDIWLYSIVARRYSGDATPANIKGQFAIDFARFITTPPADNLVWVDCWDGCVTPYTQGGGGRPILQWANGDLVRVLNFRIQPAANFTVITEVADGTGSVITTRITAGIFPARTGQDGAV